MFNMTGAETFFVLVIGAICATAVLINLFESIASIFKNKGIERAIKEFNIRQQQSGSQGLHMVPLRDEPEPEVPRFDD
jgi:hypothetical protein